MAGGRRRGALEQEVLACLAAAGRPLTVAEVLAELGGDLAYTTVLTALSRLHTKGALTREPAGRGYAYALPADPDEIGAAVTARRMSRLLGSPEDPARGVARVVAHLTPADGRLLSGLLAHGDPPGPEDPPGTSRA